MYRSAARIAQKLRYQGKSVEPRGHGFVALAGLVLYEKVNEQMLRLLTIHELQFQIRNRWLKVKQVIYEKAKYLNSRITISRTTRFVRSKRAHDHHWNRP